MTMQIDGRIGHRMKKALDFAMKFPAWHTFDTGRATKSAIERLRNRGLVEVNDYGQFRIVITHPKRRDGADR